MVFYFNLNNTKIFTRFQNNSISSIVATFNQMVILKTKLKIVQPVVPKNAITADANEYLSKCLSSKSSTQNSKFKKIYFNSDHVY